ncbi:DUF4421 domain-containing protein [Flavobacterium cupreum]|uniref:DUF4421 domain-containing protein n=2 Tax=Flavobacterium TaxID=237 RepID=A0A434A9X3_9FLAO|nr:DUF4421 family protein [Flavobacterium cupreum]RUT71175.1 DUF4421 domain-containing protein [Flavobacterium cupreum]
MKKRQNFEQIYQKTIKTSVLLLFFCLNFTKSYSQNELQKDTVNFIYYPDKIMVRANLSTQSDSYLLNDKNGPNLNLETNNSYKLFLNIDYKFIGFSYGFYPKFFGGNKDENLKGKSSFSDYNFRFFLGRWLQTVQYSKTRGYYISNMSDFSPDWVEGRDPYLKFPDFKTIQFGMSTSYIFNPKFSLKSITSLTEWQKKSAGSFVPSLIYNYNTIKSKTDDLDGKQKEFDLRLAAGYYYNFIIWDRFYIAPNLSPSLGVKFSRDKSTTAGVTTIEKNTYFTRNLDGGIKIGYNSNRILCGASLNFSSSSYNEDKSTRISNDKVYGLLYFGYRFDAPDFVRKPIEKIDGKIKM